MKKPKGLVYIILLITLLSVIATGLYLWKLTNPPKDKETNNKNNAVSQEIQAAKKKGQISVLIKNGEKMHYSSLYLKRASDGTMIRVADALDAVGLNKLSFSDTKGLSICDISGNIIGGTYEGKLHVYLEAEGIVLVNTLDLETYVKYVLPSEMPTTYPKEALKAQAVCARTYAYTHMESFAYEKYKAHLDNTTAFQVFNHFGRFPETDEAVNETAGEIISQNGKPITCYYFSTSAGKTNDMSVWGSETPSYIQCVASEETEEPFYRWKSRLQLGQVIDESLGALEELKIVSKNKSGYITELKLIYEKKTITLTKENDMRVTLGEYQLDVTMNDGSVRTDLSFVPSANFDIKQEEEGILILSGGGYGHGIGLSQNGAKLLANKGFGYKDIISYYYKEVVVKND